MATVIGNTALTAVPEKRCEIIRYKMSLALADAMFREGIISEKDKGTLYRYSAERFGINTTSIYRKTA